MARLLATESEAIVITSMLFSRILSDELIDMMQALLILGPLSPSAKLSLPLTLRSMYTNIDTDHAIQVIGDWLIARLINCLSTYSICPKIKCIPTASFLSQNKMYKSTVGYLTKVQ